MGSRVKTETVGSVGNGNTVTLPRQTPNVSPAANTHSDIRVDVKPDVIGSNLND